MSVDGRAGLRADRRGPDVGHPGDGGLRARLLVAAFTLVGEAPFTVFEDRSATAVVRAWTTGRGDLCLLRAPGLAGQPDGRPTHSVGGPARGARVSLTVRASRSALDPARQG